MAPSILANFFIISIIIEILRCSLIVLASLPPMYSVQKNLLRRVDYV
jgi:hypothetical protein